MYGYLRFSCTQCSLITWGSSVTSMVISNADNATETCIQVRYDVLEVPVTLPSQKPPADKPNPKQGIGEAENMSLVLYSYFFSRKIKNPLNEK